MASRIERIKAAEHRYNEVMGDFAGTGGVAGKMAEALGQVVQDILRFEDEGWTLISKLDPSKSKGMSLAEVKETTVFLENQVKINGGLLGRGLRLKNNHIFGRGFTFATTDASDIRPRHREVIEDHDNWSAIFSRTAVKELNRILYTSGNLFLMYDETEKVFHRLGVDTNITNALSDPEDRGKIRYILRTYEKTDDIKGGPPEVIQEWIPTFQYRERLKKRQKAASPRGRSKELMPAALPIDASGEKTAPVRRDAVIIEKRVNKDNGDTWGVPDSFSAAPWAIVYATYLKDGAKLQNALAAISFLVKVKTETAAQIAGAQVSNGRVGQATITGPDTSIQTMPKAGAIDLYEGRPLQAQVAANLDVSTTGLASDPGPGGSYASENALSLPEQLAALSRQEDFADIFRQVFHAIGCPEVGINFMRLDADPIHRVIQSLTMVREAGGIDQGEYRDATAELMDIDIEGRGLPKPDEWTGSKFSTLKAAVDAQLKADAAATKAASDGNGVTPSQGQSGSVGSLDDNGNDARNSDKEAGNA